MVKLEELEDEHFINRPAGTKDDILLADDDGDYTDTDSEISSNSDLDDGPSVDETLYERLAALRDIVPPKTRATISSVSSSIVSATSSGITYSGKGLWVLATSILLLGIPYALALGEEQQFIEEERQRSLMAEGAQGIMQGGEGDAGAAKPAL